MAYLPPPKKTIQAAFSSKSHGYESQAFIQNKAIKRIIHMLRREKLPPKPWLDLGCGIGLFERCLDQRERPAQGIYCLDRSMQALQVLKQTGIPGTHVLQGDIDNWPINGRTFGAVVLASVVQWLRNPSDVFGVIHRHLAREGRLFFSVFLEGSFAELHHLRKSAQLSVPVRFPDQDAFVEQLSEAGFEPCALERLEGTRYFSTAREALKSLSSMGATAVAGKRLLPSELKRFCQRYEQAYKYEKGIPLTQCMLSGSARKKE